MCSLRYLYPSYASIHHLQVHWVSGSLSNHAEQIMVHSHSSQDPTFPPRSLNDSCECLKVAQASSKSQNRKNRLGWNSLRMTQGVQNTYLKPVTRVSSLLPQIYLILQLPLTPGALVLIHGSVLHKSERNKSSNTRYAYTFHMIEGASGAASWDKKNWLQPTAKMPFSPLFAST